MAVKGIPTGPSRLVSWKFASWKFETAGWPHLKGLLIKQTSAAPERLFSAVGRIFTPIRSCIGDTFRK